jgi:sulfide:quinone oxidoreductase
MIAKTVLVLGGGVGGLVATDHLRRLLPSEHRIVLVERSTQHAFAPSFLWVMTGDRKPWQITRSLAQMVRPGVEVIQAEVKRIDVSAQRVATSLRDLSYDYLIVALGTDLAPETIPGLTEASHTFYTLEGASRLHEALERFTGGKVAVVVSSLPYKCPGAPRSSMDELTSWTQEADKVLVF